jgi:hypothetical protein
LADQIVPRANQFLQEVIDVVLLFASYDYADMIEGALFKIFLDNAAFYTEHTQFDSIDEDSAAAKIVQVCKQTLSVGDPFRSLHPPVHHIGY